MADRYNLYPLKHFDFFEYDNAAHAYGPESKESAKRNFSGS